jgi:hypothetical protein
VATAEQHDKGDRENHRPDVVVTDYGKLTIRGWMSIEFHPNSFQCATRPETRLMAKSDPESMILTGWKGN